MTVKEIAAKLGGVIAAGEADADKEVRGGYVSDLLSDVMANANEGDIWVTLQRHVNIVAVAQLKGLAGIVLVNGRHPEPACAEKARAEHISVVSTPLSAFDAAGILYQESIRGSHA